MSTHADSVAGDFSVIIVGAGQAGLALSYCLQQRNIRHVVFEKHRIGHAWRTQRWDSFCLVTPNWQCRLPGHAYSGSDPDGFMLKDQIVDYLEQYVARFAPPVREGVEVQRIVRGERYRVSTSSGDFLADQVVIAAGGYHRPKVPPMAAALDPAIAQLDAASYRNAQALPPGAVLVVGSGQSGCQIAEDLHLAGRDVHLCTGSAPRVARRYRGRDVVAWLEDLGHYDLPVDQHPVGVAVRKKPNQYVTGRDGGRDIDLRRFALQGMQLHGRLQNIDAQGFEFGSDLARNLDNADASCERVKQTIDAYIERAGIAAPTEPAYSPPWQPENPATRLTHAAAKLGSVIWCMGFATDYRFIELPAFDATGYPLHERGVSPVPGLYFLGLPWMYTWGSGRFCGVGRDAEHLAEQVGQRLQPSAAQAAAE
jgi:putative flavoprotein involved in K+ transport